MLEEHTPKKTKPAERKEPPEDGVSRFGKLEPNLNFLLEKNDEAQNKKNEQ